MFYTAPVITPVVTNRPTAHTARDAWVNPANAYDGDPNTYAELTTGMTIGDGTPSIAFNLFSPITEEYDYIILKIKFSSFITTPGGANDAYFGFSFNENSNIIDARGMSPDNNEIIKEVFLPIFRPPWPDTQTFADLYVFLDGYGWDATFRIYDIRVECYNEDKGPVPFFNEKTVQGDVNIGLNPLAITVNENSVFVSDANNCKISKLTKDFIYDSSTPLGPFDEPWGITNDGTHLYIADSGNNRIVKRLMSDFSYVTAIGSLGTGNNEFNYPVDITHDGTYLYIPDYYNNRIVKRLMSDLSYVDQIVTFGAGSTFNHPNSITNDGTNLYIVDSDNHRIVKILISDYTTSSIVGSYGTGNDEFAYPSCIATDGTHIYVGDGENFRIVKRLCSNLSYVSQIGSEGSGNDQFSYVDAIYYRSGYLYVSDGFYNIENDRIVKRLASDLSYVSQAGAEGSTETDWNIPGGLTSDGTYLWFCDVFNNRIIKLSLSTLAYVSELSGFFSNPVYAMVCDETNIYALEAYPGEEIEDSALHILLCLDLSRISKIINFGTTSIGTGSVSYCPTSVAIDMDYLYITCEAYAESGTVGYWTKFIKYLKSTMAIELEVEYEPLVDEKARVGGILVNPFVVGDYIYYGRYVNVDYYNGRSFVTKVSKLTFDIIKDTFFNTFDSNWGRMSCFTTDGLFFYTGRDFSYDYPNDNYLRSYFLTENDGFYIGSSTSYNTFFDCIAYPSGMYFKPVAMWMCHDEIFAVSAGLNPPYTGLITKYRVRQSDFDFKNRLQKIIDTILCADDNFLYTIVWGGTQR
jgi:hypothetical protein